MVLRVCHHDGKGNQDADSTYIDKHLHHGDERAHQEIIDSGNPGKRKSKPGNAADQPFRRCSYYRTEDYQADREKKNQANDSFG
jgi:hypothetical protein